MGPRSRPCTEPACRPRFRYSISLASGGSCSTAPTPHPWRTSTKSSLMRPGSAATTEAVVASAQREDGLDSDANEREERQPLCDLERCLGLRGREALQRRDLLEALHDEHEEVEVLRQQGADHVDPSERSGRVGAVARVDRESEHDERDDANDV